MEEPLKLRAQARCGDCGDIRRALDRYDVGYEATYAAVDHPLVEAAEQNGWARDTVVFDEETPSNSVVGHGALLEWIEARYGD